MTKRIRVNMLKASASLFSLLACTSFSAYGAECLAIEGPREPIPCLADNSILIECDKDFILSAKEIVLTESEIRSNGDLHISASNDLKLSGRIFARDNLTLSAGGKIQFITHEG